VHVCKYFVNWRRPPSVCVYVLMRNLVTRPGSRLCLVTFNHNSDSIVISSVNSFLKKKKKKKKYAECALQCHSSRGTWRVDGCGIVTTSCPAFSVGDDRPWQFGAQRGITRRFLFRASSQTSRPSRKLLVPTYSTCTLIGSTSRQVIAFISGQKKS